MKITMLLIFILASNCTIEASTSTKKKAKIKPVPIEVATEKELPVEIKKEDKAPCDTKEDILKKIEEEKKKLKAPSLQGGNSGCKVN